jgi:TrmH family RNA methyltransferase
MNERITSKDNAKIKDAFKLKDGKNPEFFLVEGFHLVEMALSAHCVVRLFSLAPYPSEVESYLVNEEVLKKLASTSTPEGIVAVCRKNEAKKEFGERILFLDGVQDPGNVGTLLRTALAFGFYDVILGPGSASIYSSKVLLASQGAIFALHALEVKDGVIALLSSLKEAGYHLLATDLKAAVAPEEIPSFDKEVLILGNEARGVSGTVLSLAESSIRIPMSGIDSLNVGVAGGILMYCFKKR